MVIVTTDAVRRRLIGASSFAGMTAGIWTYNRHPGVRVARQSSAVARACVDGVAGRPVRSGINREETTVPKDLVAVRIEERAEGGRVAHVTVNNPDAGNKVMASTLSTTAAGSNCPSACWPG